LDILDIQVPGGVYLCQMPSVFSDEPALRRAEGLIENHLAVVVQALTEN
jgi:hypothetical protein